MRLFHSSGIVFQKHNVLYFSPSILRHWVSCMNTINLSLVGFSQRFERPPSDRSFSDHSYLTNSGLSIFLIISPNVHLLGLLLCPMMTMVIFHKLL